MFTMFTFSLHMHMSERILEYYTGEKYWNIKKKKKRLQKELDSFVGQGTLCSCLYLLWNQWS